MGSPAAPMIMGLRFRRPSVLSAMRGGREHNTPCAGHHMSVMMQPKVRAKVALLVAMLVGQAWRSLPVVKGEQHEQPRPTRSANRPPGTVFKFPMPTTRLLEHLRAAFPRPPAAGVRRIDAVLAEIDRFCWEQRWMWNLGDIKRAIVRKELAAAIDGRSSPATAERGLTFLDLGTYVGYSAMTLLGDAPPADAVLVAVEGDPEHARAAREVLAMAGLDVVLDHDMHGHSLGGGAPGGPPRVILLNLSSMDALDALADAGFAFDVVLIDIEKKGYTDHLRALEGLGLLRKHAVVFADNVGIFPQTDAYRRYVRAHPALYATRTVATAFEYDEEREDAIEVTIYQGDGGRGGGGRRGEEESCVDRNASCRQWAELGECERNPDYMHWKCSQACGLCGGGGDHDDERRRDDGGGHDEL